MQFVKRAFEIVCFPGLCGVASYSPGQRHPGGRPRLGSAVFKQQINLAVLCNEAEDVLPRDFHKAGAQRHIMADVVHPAHKSFQLDARLIRRELCLACVLGERSAL